MPTGQLIASNVLTHLGLNSPDGTPGASDSNTVLSLLNVMWQAWGVDEGLIYAVTSGQFPLTAYQQNYTIGAGAIWNVQRPAKIYRALAVNAKSFTATTTATSATIAVTDTTGLYVGQGLLGTGIATATTIIGVTTNTSITASQAATANGTVTLVATGLNRNELRIIESGAYYAHNDLGASAATPEEIYCDYNADANGYSRVYVWPVVSEVQPSYLELEVGVAFALWTLGANYQIPYAMQDALEWAVAFRALSTFGVAVQPQVAQAVQAEGAKAEARMRQYTSFTRQLPSQAVMAPGTQEAAALQAQQAQIQRGA